MATVRLLVPSTDAALEWLQNYVEAESWQRLGYGVLIEHRFIGDILTGLADAGLVDGEDFQIV